MGSSGINGSRSGAQTRCKGISWCRLTGCRIWHFFYFYNLSTQIHFNSKIKVLYFLLPSILCDKKNTVTFFYILFTFFKSSLVTEGFKMIENYAKEKTTKSYRFSFFIYLVDGL